MEITQSEVKLKDPYQRTAFIGEELQERQFMENLG